MTYSLGEFIHSSTGCMLCEAKEQRVLSNQGRHGQALTTAICTNCGLVQSYPIPSEEMLRAYYRDQYRSDYKRTVTPKRKHILRYSRNAVHRLARLQSFATPGHRLLDVGSGSGEFVYLARAAGFQAAGLEPHEGYSEYTRRTFDIPVHTASIDEAMIPPASLDVVTIHHVVEHLPNPVVSLGIIHQWLRPGGILAIDVPDIATTVHAPSTRFHFAHIYNFNYHTLHALLQRSGFTVIDHPDYRSTTLFARRNDTLLAPASIAMPENYQQLWHQLTTPVNAKKRWLRGGSRIIRKLARYTPEFLQAMWIWSPRRIADQVRLQSLRARISA